MANGLVQLYLPMHKQWKKIFDFAYIFLYIVCIILIEGLMEDQLVLLNVVTLDIYLLLENPGSSMG